MRAEASQPIARAMAHPQRSRLAREGAPGQDGFSLIELLVVVVIIGVLAGIATPVFLGVQARAADAAVQSDLRHERTAITVYQSEHTGSLPAASLVDTAGLGAYGFVRGPHVIALDYFVQGSATSGAWCLLAKSSSGRVFTVSTHTAVSDGSTTSCPTTY